MLGRAKVAFLLADDFEDSEFRGPYDALTAAGFEAVVVGAEQGQHLEGKHDESVSVDRSIVDARPEDYSAVVIPGGHSPDRLRADERFVRFVQAFDRLGRPIAAICHGPQLLLSAGLVKGRTLTAWPTVQGDLRFAGAIVIDEPVVHDRNWITSRGPRDLDSFCAALVRALR